MPRPNAAQKDVPTNYAPIVAGVLLLGAGVALRQFRPTPLELPEKVEREHLDSGAQRRVRQGRDILARYMPSNMNGYLGRSLLVMGAGLLAIRILDELVDDRERMF